MEKSTSPTPSTSSSSSTSNHQSFGKKINNDEPSNLNSNSNSNPVKNCHLIVLTHGLWGTSDHFNYLEKSLNSYLLKHYPNECFFIFKTISNEKFKTYDGIDICGTRVADEILIKTNHLNNNGYKIIKFSIIGYSLGGLIARFAIGILNFKNYFNFIIPINFITFCSPHVGVLTPGNSLTIKLFNNFVPYLLGNSGKQIFLKDKTNGNLPLLNLMSIENSIFFKTLKKFKYISLYSNIRSDIRTSYWTSAISFINPFEILDKNQNVIIDNNGFINFANGSKFQLSFLNDYNPIILDVSKNINFNGLIDYDKEINYKSKDKNKYKDKINNNNNNFIQRKFKWLILIFNTFIYIPMWIIWFIIYNILQSFQSFIRVTREYSKLKDNISIYNLIESNINTPLIKPAYSNEFNKFENDLHDQGDLFLDSVFDAITSSNNINKSIFNQNSFGGNNSLITNLNELCSIPINDIKNWEFDYKIINNDKLIAFKYYQILKSFKLNISNYQIDIIKNLNKLNWSKFPIYITNTNSTHAAAIVRHDDPSFDQGKIVIQHFCEKTFKIN
ncbi:hypothetical protein C6P40_000656 [Pichia californica]|uniref:DUF676 domain-containing protein n=1 Tax=Pichia californica TaxID=460514 RepID=A0A9P6WPL5_9ASCO|nr:hypothetical protein C6P42_001993 [[Candida] californica]KAG0690942.1 hypothetical protein C6P40_000656 [[Candida] californica]